MIIIPTFRGFLSKPGGVTLTPLYYWFDASDASTLFSDFAGTIPATPGGIVRRWKNKGLVTTNWLHNSGTNAPTRQTAVRNGLDVLRFTGTNLLGSPNVVLSPIGSVARTVYTVYKHTATGINVAWSYGGTAAGTAFGHGSVNGLTGCVRIGGDVTVAAPAGFLGVCSVNSASDAIVTEANGTTATGTTPATGSGALYCGALNISSQFPLASDLCEIRIYLGNHDTATRASIKAELAAKWGVTF